MRLQDVSADLSITASRLAQLGQEPSAFKEAQFQAVLVEVLKRNDALVIRPNFGVKLADWPKVGPVDVAVMNGDAVTALFELKWGAGNLYNCVWDLEKVAVALASGVAYRGFLVAGAPSQDWNTARGAELFGGPVRSG
jgi:hypothetical protein